MHIGFWVLYGDFLFLDPAEVLRPAVTRARRKGHRMDDLVSNFAETLEVLQQFTGQTETQSVYLHRIQLSVTTNGMLLHSGMLIACER